MPGSDRTIVWEEPSFISFKRTIHYPKHGPADAWAFHLPPNTYANFQVHCLHSSFLPSKYLIGMAGPRAYNVDENEDDYLRADYFSQKTAGNTATFAYSSAINLNPYAFVRVRVPKKSLPDGSNAMNGEWSDLIFQDNQQPTSSTSTENWADTGWKDLVTLQTLHDMYLGQRATHLPNLTWDKTLLSGSGASYAEEGINFLLCDLQHDTIHFDAEPGEIPRLFRAGWVTFGRHVPGW